MRITTFLLTFILIIASYSCFAADGNQNPQLECAKSLADKPELEILRGKMQLSNSEVPTLEMMANSKKPNKNEKTAISLYVDFAEACLHQGDDWRARNWPSRVNALFEEHLVGAKATIADLYGGMITYGDYSKRVLFANARLKTDLSVFAEKMKAEQLAKYLAQEQQQRQLAQDADRSHRERLANDADAQQRSAQFAAQQEQAKRLAFLRMLENQRQESDILGQQQLDAIRRAAPRRAVQTNCNSFGYSISCTSQ